MWKKDLGLGVALIISFVDKNEIEKMVNQLKWLNKIELLFLNLTKNEKIISLTTFDAKKYYLLVARLSSLLKGLNFKYKRDLIAWIASIYLGQNIRLIRIGIIYNYYVTVLNDEDTKILGHGKKLWDFYLLYMQNCKLFLKHKLMVKMTKKLLTRWKWTSIWLADFLFLDF